MQQLAFFPQKHVIIGLDNTQVFADLDLAAASATDFAQEDDDISDDVESDFVDDFDEEGVFAVDEEDGDNDGEDEAPPRWSNLETMNSCHPLSFARMVVEVMNDKRLKRRVGLHFSRLKLLRARLRRS